MMAREKIPVLASICMAALVLPLSFAGAAIAVPSIGRDLEGAPGALSWITNAFMLSFGSTLMAAGTLADRFGRKKVFVAGMTSFVAVSLMIGIVPNLVWLDLLRAVQGVAAAAVLAAGSASLAHSFEGNARVRALSLLGTTFGLGLAFGPVLSGVLIEIHGWRAIFFASAGIGTVSLFFGLPCLRETRAPDGGGVDVWGTFSFTGMLVLLTWAVLQVAEQGWGSSVVIGSLAGSVMLLMIFVALQRNVKNPMLDLSLFRYPRFIGVQVLPIATAYCYVVLLVLLPIRFVGIEGRSEIDAGLIMIALSLPMLVVPSFAALLAGRISAGVLSCIGLMIAAGGLWLLGDMPLGDRGWMIVVPLLIIGVGAAIPWGLMDGLSLDVVPEGRAGMASGIFNTTRVAGEGLILAVVGGLLGLLIRGQLPEGLAVQPGHLAGAAQGMAAGDLSRAMALLTGVDRDELVQAYAEAFKTTSHGLALATSICALLVLVLLRTDEMRLKGRDHGG